MKVSLIVAMAKNGVIGRDNQLPWHLSGDLRYFKAVTMGKPIIMGRKTWLSIGRPLPGRTNIVVTRQQGWQPEGGALPGVRVVHSLSQAVAVASEVAVAANVSEIMVMGGAEIYQQALAGAHRLYITEVDAEVDGDAYFPQLTDSAWKEIERTAGDVGGDYRYDFVIKERIN